MAKKKKGGSLATPGDAALASPDAPPAGATSLMSPALEQEPAPQSGVKKLVSQYGGVVMAAALVLCARGSLADHYYVPSESMLPTVEIGDRIIVDKRAFGLRVPATSFYLLEFGDPKRGDVVVLSSPGDGPVLLKRIVGLPGDDLEVRDGRLIVDGELLPVETKGDRLYEKLDDVTHRVSFALGGGQDWGPTKIPPREYLVMGDNRGGSRDGRVFGLIPRDILLGRAVRMYLHSGDWVWRPVDEPIAP